MRTLLLTGAAVLSLATTPFVAMAQEGSAPAGSTNTVDDKRGAFQLDAEQQATFDAWPADRRATYTAWPPTYQEYYWTIEPAQQEAYWLLTDAQRETIYVMTPQQRVLAWQSIQEQLASAQTANQANAAVSAVSETQVDTRTTASGQTQTVVTTSTGNVVPPSQETLNKEYPVCRGNIQDSCINPREAGLNYGNRPLDHWPGAPASELDDTAAAGGQ